MRILFYSAAAATFLAGAMALLFLNSTPSVALGDVVKAAQEHKLVRMTMTQITEDKNGRGETISTVYWDLKAPRCRSESRIGEAVLLDIQDYVKGRQLMTNSQDKSATLFTPGAKRMSFLENLKQLQERKETTSAKDQLDGREVVKYVLKETEYATTLWVDPKTKLPVRMEYEALTPPANIKSNQWTWTNFEWDPELRDSKNPDELFSTEPPKGYTVKESVREN